ncbi:pyridoxal phosphate-dependent aminotransferase [Natronoglycomyces albus]|uniref:Aminotransferase n=1 Tax=Natronoglycomyces albus TaxID=2811108 RepID=A0A895XLA2_9ACTN|nr:pyridoxal phosphate-dependent aminotransferase [Natronoglycomyces albus]QSB04333.1 pyridoxal phosphate-dependent aminotransferase [Natronoglycomyces albus]
MSVSATLAANEIIAARRAAGQDVLALAFGEAGLPVHPALIGQLAASAGEANYGPVAGIGSARDAVAGYWTRRELTTGAEQVLLGPGSKSLLYATLHSLQGDVAIPQPSWVSYAAQIELLGRKAITVPTLPGEGGVTDPQALEQTLRDQPGITAVVATLPDNPTGTIASKQTVEKLAEVARRHELVIVSDEIYRDLVFDQSNVVSPAQWAPERTVVTTSLSKNLALGGWRIGAARFPGSPLGQKLRAAVASAASEMWSAPVMPMQHAAAYAWSDPTELVERVGQSRQLHAAVARAVAGVFAQHGAAIQEPQGGFYVYPDFEMFRERLEERWGIEDSAGLAQVLLDDFNVGVLPGSAFGAPTGTLTARVATSQLYGNGTEQRLAALESADPVKLPWIEEKLSRLDSVLEDFLR